tara:strand:+ start:811 stop:1020 length:210 start_codon:yes stop_codon:yes gene_type:complete
MIFNGKKIKEGDLVTYVTGHNMKGSLDYEYGKIKSFSESGVIFIETLKNKRLTAIRQEELVNVKGKERE